MSLDVCVKELARDPPPIPNKLLALTLSLSLIIMTYQPTNEKEICHTMVVCEVRPDKDDPDRTRITIEGNRICFPGGVCTSTASLELLS